MSVWHKYDMKIKITTNSVIMRRLLTYALLPWFGMFILMIGIITANDRLTQSMLLVIFQFSVLMASFFLVLLFFGIMVAYKNTYWMRCSLGHKEVSVRTVHKEIESSPKANTIATILAALVTRPGSDVYSFGVSNKSTPYNQVRKMRIDDNSKLIVLSGEFPIKVYVFCPEDRYQDIRDFLIRKVEAGQIERAVMKEKKAKKKNKEKLKKNTTK